MWFHGLDEVTLQEVARQCAKDFPQGRFFLRGALGSGKSTFVRAWLKSLLGEDATIPSPSYSLIESYADGQYCHADLYRLANAQAWLDIGGSEYVANSRLCFLEWPERLGASWLRFQPDAVFYFWHQEVHLRKLFIIPLTPAQEEYWQAQVWQRFCRALL